MVLVWLWFGFSNVSAMKKSGAEYGRQQEHLTPATRLPTKNTQHEQKRFAPVGGAHLAVLRHELDRLAAKLWCGVFFVRVWVFLGVEEVSQREGERGNTAQGRRGNSTAPRAQGHTHTRGATAHPRAASTCKRRSVSSTLRPIGRSLIVILFFCGLFFVWFCVVCVVWLVLVVW